MVFTGENPDEIDDIVQQAKKAGWLQGVMQKGRHAGQGFTLRQLDNNGNLTGRFIEWHPGGGHHGLNPYWKICTGESGKIWVGFQFLKP